jgi:putative membrane protein
MSYLIEFLLFTGLVALTAKVLPGIKLKSLGTALIVALVFSLLNFGVNLLFFWLVAPLKWLTLGLITFVLNGLLLWLTDKMIEDFEIKDLPTTAIAAVVLTIGRIVIDRLI